MRLNSPLSLSFAVTVQQSFFVATVGVLVESTVMSVCAAGKSITY